MKGRINRSGCIGCGICHAVCPEVFEMAEDGFAAVACDTIPPELEGNAEEARDSCPVSVISLL